MFDDKYVFYDEQFYLKYIFTIPTCATIIIIFKPCALNVKLCA
jgi:hypothetical protein